MELVGGGGEGGGGGGCIEGDSKTLKTCERSSPEFAPSAAFHGGWGGGGCWGDICLLLLPGGKACKPSGTGK
jgi:hypothetical protein